MEARAQCQQRGAWIGKLSGMAEGAHNGRRILVTGGTGALGREIVGLFLEQGASVAIPWIVKAERDDMEEAHQPLLASGRLVLTEADVATPEGAAKAVALAREPEVLVNAAGGFAGGPRLHETELAVWEQMFTINVITAASMCAAALPGMLGRGKGVIINVASRAAMDAPAGLAAYSAAKAAVAVLTRSLQNEVAQQGIRVNAIVPTTIDTPANRMAMPDADFGTWTAPAEIAKVVSWLASDHAASVRGGLIPV